MRGIVDIATVAALLFVPAKKTCTQDVSAHDKNRVVFRCVAIG